MENSCHFSQSPVIFPNSLELFEGLILSITPFVIQNQFVIPSIFIINLKYIVKYNFSSGEELKEKDAANIQLDQVGDKVPYVPFRLDNNALYKFDPL